MLLKCCTQDASKFGKLSSGHRTGKGQFSFQSQGKAMPKNVQITIQLHSGNSHASKVMLKILQFRLAVCEPTISRCSSWFRKSRGTRDQIANICWIIDKTREFQKNIYFCFLGYAKAFDCVDHNKLEKFLKRWEYQTTLSASWEICIQVKKQQLELDMEQQTGSKWKGVCQGCILSPAYLTYMQSTLCEMPGWMKHSWNQNY